MKHNLNMRIVRHLIKEEMETKARYQSLGRRYKIPALIKAGTQEGQHAKIFRKIEKNMWGIK